MSQGKGPARWQATWLRAAQTRGALARLLWPISLVFGALVATRRWLYQRGILRVHRLRVPVLVVGNVVVGGAGKTPCTLALVNHLQARGWRPGVVSRGHGRRGEGLVHVRHDTPAHEAGDEPLLIHRRTGVPVCVARSRVDAARALLAAHTAVDVLVCDDGMQHLALGRDLTVAVFDDRGTGNGWLLPAGLLREPWPGAASSPWRPDLVLRQRREGAPAAALPSPDGIPVFDAVRQLAPFAQGPQGEQVELSRLQGQPLVAVAGIARPDVFFAMLREHGLTLAEAIALPDHAGDAIYEDIARCSTHPLICTEKDAVKLFGLRPAGACVAFWSVPLALRIEPGFFEAVDAGLARLSSRHGHQTA